MKVGIEDYIGIAGDGDLRAIDRLAARLKGKSIVHVNSTTLGGGVAELLQRMVPLLSSLGLDTKWKTIKGSKYFFEITKRMHNALQGSAEPLTKKMWDFYAAVNRENSEKMSLEADCVFIHDPQPAMLVEKKGRGIWVWRCHIDISHPDSITWRFLKDIVEKYDAAIFSVSNFAQTVAIPQFMIHPSIDPLSEKNISLEPEEIKEVFDKYGIPMDKPVLLQVSRFDAFKDPVGVIKAYRLVKKYHDCRLVLAGGAATDDPEGERVFNEVLELAGKDPDIHVLLIPPFSDREINAFQRGAAIVLQKSLREGFGLVVAESLWKGKPVIAGDVGGIPLQIMDGVTGFLVHSTEGMAYRIRHLLEDPEHARKMGEAGKERIRKEFLITHHIKQYLALWTAIERIGEKVIYI